MKSTQNWLSLTFLRGFNHQMNQAENESIINDQLSRNLQSKETSSGLILFNLFMVFVCICCASVACGLTQGLLSLNPLEMNVKLRSGTHTEKDQAAKVLPLITKHHLLLVTLMLFNATANEAMPLFLDNIVPTYITIILSVTLVLAFGEIIPSAIFTGPNQLQIASFLAPFTWFIIIILYPVSYPISIGLDAWLGHDDGMTMFNRKEIYTMMQIQQEEAPRRGVDTENAVINEEVTMIGGALKLRDLNVEEVMVNDIFMLSVNDKLTIMDELPIRNFMTIFGRRVHYVWPDQKLHEGDPFYEVKGIITMEDIFEEIIGDEILDETDEDQEVYTKLQSFNINVDFAQLRHIGTKQATTEKDNKLSSEEVKAVVSFLNSQVPQIQQLFGENNVDEIKKLVELSQVMVIKSSSPPATMNTHSNTPEADLLIFSDDSSHNGNLIVDESAVEKPTLASPERINQSSKDAKDNAEKQGTVQREYLYKRDRVSNVCTLILSGELKVIAGKEEFEIDKGPWSIIGADILVQDNGAYVCDFSAYISSPEFRCLRILKPGVSKPIREGPARRRATVKITNEEAVQGMTAGKPLRKSTENSTTFNPIIASKPLEGSQKPQRIRFHSPEKVGLRSPFAPIRIHARQDSPGLRIPTTEANNKSKQTLLQASYHSNYSTYSETRDVFNPLRSSSAPRQGDKNRQEFN